MTKLEACRSWTQKFNAIPLPLINKAYPYMEGIDELTPICKGNMVWSNTYQDTYEVLSVEGNTAIIEVEEEEKEVELDDLCLEDNSSLPMWGTIWTLCDIDSIWIENNLQEVAECGFRIYESDELGVFIGIDGCGYDFYEAHWLPLYEARGLRWHDKEVA